MQYRITDLPAALTLTDAMPLETADMREDNAAQQSRKITIGQLRDFIMGSVVMPAGVKWVTRPTVTVDAADPYKLNVSAGEATFDDVPVIYQATSFTVAAPTLQRFDLIYATPQGTYGIETGDESSNPALPNYPEDSLYVGHALINAAGGEVQEPASYITQEQVLSLLGDYLPLANPEGNNVFWGDEASGGELGFFGAKFFTEVKRGINFGGQVAELTDALSSNGLRTLFAAGTKLHLSEVLAKSDDSGPYMEVHLRTTEGSTETDTVYQFRHTGITVNGAPFAGGSEPGDSTETYLKGLPGYGPSKALRTDANGNFYWADSNGTEPATDGPSVLTPTATTTSNSVTLNWINPTL